MKTLNSPINRIKMRTFNFIFLNLCFITIVSLVSADLDAKEGRAIAECLDRFGGPTLENSQRLQRFRQWSDTYEEIPCFTNCYLNKMFDFYNETKGFNGPNVIKHFGNVIYEACKAKLVEGNNPCEVAYNGFHCMVNLENDPFVVIENMAGLNADAKLAMKDCLHKFDKFEWEKFHEYSSYPVKEPIPCYTRCFVEKLHLFNHRLRKWNTESMLEKLGFPEENANISGCLAMGQRRNRNSCAWMYREFVCFLMSRNIPKVEKKL